MHVLPSKDRKNFTKYYGNTYTVDLSAVISPKKTKAVLNWMLQDSAVSRPSSARVYLFPGLGAWYDSGNIHL